MTTNIKVFTAENFKIVGREELTTNSAYLNAPGVKFDERLGICSSGVDMSNFEWYFNYLKSAFQIFNKMEASKKPYCTYLLDIGYIPVIYLPTPFVQLSKEMFNILDNAGIDYVTMHPTSFVYRHTNMDSPDAWASKMTLSKQLNIPITEITSEKVVRRLFNV